METKDKKEFDAVKFSRDQKDRLSAMFLENDQERNF
jgi:hypothetical protein